MDLLIWKSIVSNNKVSPQDYVCLIQLNSLAFAGFAIALGPKFYLPTFPGIPDFRQPCPLLVATMHQ